MSPTYDNRISLQKLEVFCLVVELGGVSRAADHLFVAQPVVTAHIRTLQERLGPQLMYRDGRRMRLTEAGERVYAWASEVLSRTRELTREIDGLADGRRGSIVIAASMSIGSYLLPPVLTRFRHERPQAEITLSVSDPESATASVQAGECDFAVIVAETVPEPQLLNSELLGHEPIVLVAAPDTEPRAAAVDVAELATLPLVSPPRSHIRRAIVDHQLRQAGVEPGNIVIELGHPEAMKRATRGGLGAALLFRCSVEPELADGALREIAIRGASLAVPVYAVARRGKQLSPIQDALLDAVRASMRDRHVRTADQLVANVDGPPARSAPAASSAGRS